MADESSLKLPDEYTEISYEDGEMSGSGNRRWTSEDTRSAVKWGGIIGGICAVGAICYFRKPIGRGISYAWDQITGCCVPKNVDVNLIPNDLNENDNRSESSRNNPNPIIVETTPIVLGTDDNDSYKSVPHEGNSLLPYESNQKSYDIFDDAFFMQVKQVKPLSETPPPTDSDEPNQQPNQQPNQLSNLIDDIINGDKTDLEIKMQQYQSYVDSGNEFANKGEDGFANAMYALQSSVANAVRRDFGGQAKEADYQLHDNFDKWGYYLGDSDERSFDVR